MKADLIHHIQRYGKRHCVVHISNKRFLITLPNATRSFWDVYSELTVSQKRDLLAFVTSSDRIPIRGFSDVSFTIQRNGPDSDKYVALG